MLRLILAWLLVACVPLQAHAAIAMVSCGSAHGDHAPTAVGVAHHADDGDAMAAAMAGSEHDHAKGHASPTPRKTCATCASCCSSIAMTGSLHTFGPQDAAEAFPAGVRAAVAAFLSPGLERPPRDSFA